MKKIIQPPLVKNGWYHFAGGIFIVLNFVRHSVFGYRTPRTFSIDKDIHKSVEYDFSVVEGWVEGLAAFGKGPECIRDKVILELGPGPDLGIGLILLAMGARKYIAFDVNPLAQNAPQVFYDALFRRLEDKFKGCDIPSLREQLSGAYAGRGDRLAYIVDGKFEISRIGEHPDLVFSQAAFEHFEDVEKTFAQLSGQVAGGCILSAEVDLATHTGWIKDRDPLNIYRYGDGFWRWFKFSGAPNRMRVFEYTGILEKNGWQNLIVEPLCVLEDNYLEQVKPALSKRFRELGKEELKLLHVRLTGQKG
ncbi:MAG: hypothetical protein WC335_06805 [Candidatus Omnitrophota bacterium]|jgi:hypothetical protein